MRTTGATTSAAAGMPILLLLLALDEPEAHQGRASFEVQNRIGGSRPGPRSAPGASWTATLDCHWGSRDRREDARRVDGTTSYLLDGMSVVAQYAPDRSRTHWYTQSLARIDEVLSVVNAQGKYWYEADALGSTYALTDAAGNVAARGGYDVFGAPVAISGNVGQPFGFTGREHERDSGLVYARARYLNPAVGAWTQPDPAKFADGLNRFLYGHSRPTLLRDPTGLLAGLPLVPLLLTDIAFTLGLDVGMLLSFGFPGVVIVVGGVVAAAAAVAILVSLVMLIDAVRADYALRVSQDSLCPSGTFALGAGTGSWTATIA